ncbi:LLM class flavin-dependent oxidoreductase [Methylosinus sp. LW4]|uniref:LLM class flavin-dependent oxidoreductase n=1 Tax=Methylosinus sp. LW4 TaxID=136993 RepID=UPI00036C1FEB|nr:LLM class flavin-dependent oxidoreductase [Methylosinus sp. LW4]
MKFGVFCPFHTHLRGYKECFDRQAALVRRAEDLGFDEAWVAEHHFNPNGASSSILVLLGHLATITSRIRLGSAALLLAYRNPIQAAEDIATVDIISNGRLNLGVARGGSATLPNKHFHVPREQSRDMLIEGLTLVERLLYEDHVTFAGDHFAVDDVSLVPKPLQRRIPTFLATTAPDAIRYAASRGLGTMAAPPYSMERVRQTIDHYRAAAPGADPGMTLSRFFFAAPSREEALNETLPQIRSFVDRKRALALADVPVSPSELNIESVIERSLIGSYEDVIEKLNYLEENMQIRAVLLRPMTIEHDRSIRALDRFVRYIQPKLQFA